MTVINKANREICAKIVYYGPGLSGKTTTLRRIYESIRPSNRGEMVSLATEGDRTLFFDFLPIKVERVGDATVRLALYTVPGQVFYNATRKLVLQNADGVVFVADSQQEAMDSNLESMDNLKDNLKEMGIHPEQIPLVIQYNKRDIPGVLPVSELRRMLNPREVPDFETIAFKGKGLMDALRAVTRGVIKSLKVKGVIAGPKLISKVPAFGDADGASLSNSLSSQIDALSGASSSRDDAGFLGTLLPGEIAPVAEKTEAAFRSGQHKATVLHGMQALRACLKSAAGGGSEVEQALMAGLTGPDFARLLRIEKDASPSREDAAYAMLMLGLVGVRTRR